MTPAPQGGTLRPMDTAYSSLPLLLLLPQLLSACAGGADKADDTSAVTDGGSADGGSSDDGGSSSSDSGSSSDGGGGDTGAAMSCDAPVWNKAEALTISTQTEVAVFCDQWNAFAGDLTIDVGAAEDTITELDGLACLCAVGGDLVITGAGTSGRAPPPPHVVGDIELALLETVGGDLTISHHPSITNLEGLRALTTVGGDLVVTGNASLQVTGFYALTTVGGTARFTDLAKLLILRLSAATTLGGLELGTEGVGDTLVYTVEVGLDRIEQISGDMHVRGVNNLVRLGAASLVQVDGDLTVEASCQMDLDLPLLATVGSLRLQGNCGLQDLDGLAALSAITGADTDGRSLTLSGNNYLDSDEISAWRSGLSSEGTGSVLIDLDTSCTATTETYGEGFCD
jgi:hypothetical protein